LCCGFDSYVDLSTGKTFIKTAEGFVENLSDECKYAQAFYMKNKNNPEKVAKIISQSKETLKDLVN
jgi:hypothetical protein